MSWPSVKLLLRYGDCSIFHFFEMAAAVILDFYNSKMLTVGRIKRIKLRPVPNFVKIDSAVFVGSYCYRQTDRQTTVLNTRSLTICRIYVRSTAMRPNNNDYWSKKFDKKAALPQHMDGSVVFVRWRQCASHLTRCFFGPTLSKTQMASRLVLPFLH